MSNAHISPTIAVASKY